ncbi:MAG: exodeoxyribonuclease V subunit gamma [Chthoniobacterales bacterium]|nr:exodeoxyribonuclease V subunit gamma [Chthoniobacterales bacterium]
MTIAPHPTFDSLLGAVIAGGWTAPGPAPEPRPVVIPSVPFSDHLQLRIADRIGVCMGLEFLTPRAFVARAEESDSATGWEPESLAWKILPRIGGQAKHLGVTNPSSRDAFALASALADQFDQYAHFRPDLLRRWIKGEPAFPSRASQAVRDSEAWQRRLFADLHESAPHPLESLDAQRNDADFLRRLKHRFPRLLVLGSGTLDPLLVEMLGLLAVAGGEVTIHVILPSLEYLGHLRSQRALPDEKADPEEFPSADSHPLLQSMGRHAIGTFLLLGKLDDQYTHWPEPGRSGGPRGTLLETLQSDIRAVAFPERQDRSFPDRSLRIHSCFGPRREMETVRDEILRAFEELPGLMPSEIHLVTPSLETYAPLVPAVLGQGDCPLEVRLMEEKKIQTAPVPEALLALLDVARAGRFEASRLLGLLSLEAVQSAWGMVGDDRAEEFLRRLVIESGLTQSLGSADTPEPGTWIFARERLVAGAWFGMDEGECYPDGSCVLPVADQLSGDDELREKFLSWLATLEAVLRAWTVPAPPAVWSVRLSDACGTLLSGDDEAMLALRNPLAFLGAVDGAEAVDAGVVFDWLGAHTAEHSRRARVSGRISFGHFRHLQNLPCRVLIMVGMQDGAFPGQSRPPVWDLLRHDPRAWDRNSRIDDRQMFLDALLAPRDRLIITAGTRNPRTGKTEPFSSCVDELLRVCETMGAARSDLVTAHRLQPFAAEYFSPPPASFDRDAQAVGEVLAAGRVASRPFCDAASGTTEPLPEEIPVGRLIKFWKDPAAVFLAAQGVVLPREEVEDESFDRAPVVLDELMAWTVRHAIVEEVAFDRGNLARAEAVLRANRKLPPGALGGCEWGVRRDEAEPLATALRGHLGEKSLVAWTSRSGSRVVGEIALTRSGDELLGFHAGECKKPKHFLAPWIHAVLFSAAGEPLPTRLFDQANPEGRVLPAIPTEEATAMLEVLVAGFCEGRMRPLAYAPGTSEELEKQLAKNNPEAMSKAAEDWNKEDKGHGGGEGREAGAVLAWRDTDPFADPAPWEHWAGAVAAPLKKWRES